MQSTLVKRSMNESELAKIRITAQMSRSTDMVCDVFFMKFYAGSILHKKIRIPYAKYRNDQNSIEIFLNKGVMFLFFGD